MKSLKSLRKRIIIRMKFLRIIIVILVASAFICLIFHFWDKWYYAIINSSLVVFLAAFYSYVELMNSIEVRSIFNTKWGILYLFLNGFLGFLALIFTYKGEVNSSFLGVKILVAGTSALALLRVITIPIKHSGVENRMNSMIEIILARVQLEYVRERSKIDLKELKEIMKGVDYRKAAENIPILAGSLQTIKPLDAQNLKEEIQTLLSLEEGSNLKHITLGSILARYIGMSSLRNLVNEIKEEIKIDSDSPTVSQNDMTDNQSDLSNLIQRYS